MLKKACLLIVWGFAQFYTASLPAQDGESDNWISTTGRFQLSYDSQLDPIVINQIHSWTLHLSDAQGEPLSGARFVVDGGMPAHNHGLATAPAVEELGKGEYLLQGLRFHMMGYWELRMTITQAGVSDTVLVTLNL